jgi:hypothetical protein
MIRAFGRFGLIGAGYHGIVNCPHSSEVHVIILGVVLLLLGFFLSIPVLWTIGVILLVVGAALWILGSMGRAVGGRRHYY